MIPEFVAETRTVHLPGGLSFEVRGLGVLDLSSLIRLHLDDMEEVRTLVLERLTPGITTRSVGDLGLEVVQRMPLLAASMIALAADDLAGTERVVKMPLHVQFAALKHVCELTFEDVAGLKLMLTTAFRMVSAALPLPVPSSP